MNWTFSHFQHINHRTEQNQKHIYLRVPKSVTPSNPSLKIKQLKTVVSEKKEFEYQNTSILTSFLPVLAIQDSKSDAENTFYAFKEQVVLLK